MLKINSPTCAQMWGRLRIRFGVRQGGHSDHSHASCLCRFGSWTAWAWCSGSSDWLNDSPNDPCLNYAEAISPWFQFNLATFAFVPCIFRFSVYLCTLTIWLWTVTGAMTFTLQCFCDMKMHGFDVGSATPTCFVHRVLLDLCRSIEEVSSPWVIVDRVPSLSLYWAESSTNTRSSKKIRNLPAGESSITRQSWAATNICWATCRKQSGAGFPFSTSSPQTTAW